MITPDVEALRDDFGFPGMRILQFGFSSSPKNLDLPHNYHRNVVVYTGTHDNDTAAGWFSSVAGEGSTRDAEQIEREREFCLKYLNTEGKEINWDFIRAVLASVANTAVVPLQDVLGLGTEARMNLPNSTAGNWAWRVKARALTSEIAARLKGLTELYGRATLSKNSLTSKRKARKGFSQRNAKLHLVFAIFAPTVASFAVKIVFASLIVLLPSAPVCFSQTARSVSLSSPKVSKIEPPSWWLRSSVNPVRLLIRGSNLQQANVQAIGRDLRVVGFPTISDQGTYLFVNVAISPKAQPVEHKLLILTRGGFTYASFEILPPLNRRGRFQGFSPADVMYLIMIDRFSDGDPTNDDPPQSRGIYDRQNKFYYHGGDLQGVIDRLPYLRDLGVTAIWLTPWYDNYDHPNQIELKEGKPSTGFHGYNPQDFYGVEEHFGTFAKLRQLVEAAHRSGIKIIQDEVVNHTGPYHPWVDDPVTPTWFNGTKAHHRKNVFQTWVLHDPRPVADLYLETMQGWFLDSS